MSTSDDIDARRRALRDAHPTWKPRTLHGFLDRCAEQFGERPLVLTDAQQLSYADVADQSRTLADGFALIGIRPGDRVGMLIANYPDFVVAKFAIARVGAIAVPFNFLYQDDELRYVLEDSGCRALVSMTSFGGIDYQAMLDRIAPGWDGESFPGTPPCADDTLPELRDVILLATDDPARPGARRLSDLADIGARHRGMGQHDSIDPGAIADMLYTSGTTGTPKGVLTTHDAVLRTAYASALTRAYEDGRRILFSLPCYHMFGYVEGLLSVMYAGGAIIPLTAFSAQAYFEGIERHRATDILCVPTMAIALVESDIRDRYDLSSLNAILCGSAPAPIWLWKQIEADFGVSEIVTGYGMTECGGAMTLTRPEDPLHLTSETVGRPKMAGAASVPGTDDLVTYKTVDPATAADLPPGHVGEFVSSGPTTMRGFWNRPDQTAAALRDDWLHSGDLGLVGPDGYLHLTGRSREVYKSGGELVMPKEIEDLLASHPDVSQVFAVGIQDDRWGEIGCAVVVPVAGATITESEVIALCKRKLAKFKVPKRVVFYDADALPTTPATGKVQKYRLVQQLVEALDQSDSSNEG